MSRNRRMHANVIEVASITRFVVAAVFVIAVGLSYVFLKNQLHTTGRRITTLTQELNTLESQNEALRSRISSLSSRRVLQNRLNEGFIKMIAIADERIVRINASQARSAASEIQAVSNTEIAK